MVRQHGVDGSTGGPSRFDHRGFGYRNRAEFHARAAEYIAAGLAHNQCVVYVGAGGHDELRAELATLPGLTDTSAVKVTPAHEIYGVPTGTDIIDPQAAVAAWTAAAENAIQQGYAGICAVSDVTSLAGRAEQRKALARFEFLIDQKLAVDQPAVTLPISLLCAYHLDDAASDTAELICLHRVVGGPRPPTFRLHAGSAADLALAGEIDAACGHTFITALQWICPLINGNTVVIDAENLEFVSHRPLLAVESYARATDLHIVLRTSQRIPHRLAELLPLGNVRVEQPSADNRELAGSPLS